LDNLPGHPALQAHHRRAVAAAAQLSACAGFLSPFSKLAGLRFSLEQDFFVFSLPLI
jgi:hypothetical protein